MTMNPTQRNTIAHLLQTSALALTLSAGLSACGSQEESIEAGPVAATVGSSTIAVSQIDLTFASTPMTNAPDEAVQAAREQVLERLIDQQLAARQATDSKLHLSPDVVSQLEVARQDVLARAYLKQLTATIAEPLPEEVSKYYQEHPALFAERRVFNLQEIRVPRAAEVIGDLQKLAEQGRPMDDVAAFLRTREVQFGGGSATRSADQIPLELLPRVHALKDGQSTVILAGDSASFLRVDSSQPVPVSEAAAAPEIAKHLNNQRSAEAVSLEIKRLRDATTITYVGEFVRAADKSPTNP